MITALEDLCLAIVDCEHKTSPIDAAGEYFAVGTPAMRGNVIDYGQARRISHATFEKWTRRLTPKFGDLLFAREAPVGPVVLVPETDNVAPGQRTVLIRPDPALADSLYLYYLLSSPQQQELLQAKASGSTVAHLNVLDVRRFPLDLPPLPQQKAIAALLGALDDKVAANAKLAGVSTRLAEEFFNLTCEREALVWLPLGSVAKTVLGGTPSREIGEYWTGGTVPWLNSGKANEERVVQPSAFITEEALSRSAAKLMPAGATLIAITGATLGQVARLEIQAAGNQSLIGIWSPDAALNDWLYFAVRSQIPQLLTRATGAAQQHVNKRDADALEVPLVDQEVLIDFAVKCGGLLRVAASCDRENLSLAATRDALLPHLMSGKLRVKDAEKVLEGVL